MQSVPSKDEDVWNHRLVVFDDATVIKGIHTVSAQRDQQLVDVLGEVWRMMFGALTRTQCLVELRRKPVQCTGLRLLLVAVVRTELTFVMDEGIEALPAPEMQPTAATSFHHYAADAEGNLLARPDPIPIPPASSSPIQSHRSRKFPASTSKKALLYSGRPPTVLPSLSNHQHAAAGVQLNRSGLGPGLSQAPGPLSLEVPYSALQSSPSIIAGLSGHLEQGAASCFQLFGVD